MTLLAAFVWWCGIAVCAILAGLGVVSVFVWLRERLANRDGITTVTVKPRRAPGPDEWNWPALDPDLPRKIREIGYLEDLFSLPAARRRANLDRD